MYIVIWIFMLLAIFKAAAVIYYTTRKVYIVMYGLSGIFQLIAVIYALIEFDRGRGIILVIIAAAVIMMVEGYLISKCKKSSEKQTQVEC